MSPPDPRPGADPGTLTRLIPALRRADPDAVAALWRRFYTRLVGVARKVLAAGTVDSASDVATEAFLRFCRAVARPESFPRLDDSGNLWALLVRFTVREAIDSNEDHPHGDAGVDGVAGREPAPDFAVEVDDWLGRLFARLPDDELGLVARLKLEGHTNEAIAARIGRAVCAVERRLRRIRRYWAPLLGLEET